MEKFSAKQGIKLVFKRLVLLLEESSPCLLLRREKWVLLLNIPSPIRQKVLVRKEYQCSAKNSVYIQRIIFTVDFNFFQIRHPIPACVHILCTQTWKYFVPHFMCSLLVRVIGTGARWLFKNSCLWDNNRLQAARGILREFIIFSWTRSSTVRNTEPGPNSKDH